MKYIGYIFILLIVYYISLAIYEKFFRTAPKQEKEDEETFAINIPQRKPKEVKFDDYKKLEIDDLIAEEKKNEDKVINEELETILGKIEKTFLGSVSFEKLNRAIELAYY